MIALLSPEHYLSPLKPWSDGAHFTHLARLDFAGETASAFVKIYPPGTGGIIGEALGYLACVHLDLPRPPHVAVVPVPVIKLRGLPCPEWLPDYGSHAWAWACERLNGRTLEQYYRAVHSQDAVYSQLLRSGSGAHIAAVDETLSNGDRNGGSLIRQNRGTWAVIDHGECLGSHCWPVAGPYDSGTTTFLHKAHALIDDDQRRQLHSGTIAAAQQLAQIIPEWKPLLDDLLHELNLARPGQAVMPFLQTRTAKNWMAKRLHFLV